MSGSDFAKRCAPQLLPVSVSNDFWIAIKEWAWTTVYTDFGLRVETCRLCLQEQLRYHFEIRNRHNGNTLDVGSSCIERFDIEGKQAVLAKYRQLQAEAKRRGRQERVLVALRLLWRADAPNRDYVGRMGKSVTTDAALPPRAVHLLASRMRALGIDHDPADFTVSLREDKPFIVGLSDEDFAWFGSYLSPRQNETIEFERTLAASIRAARSQPTGSWASFAPRLASAETPRVSGRVLCDIDETELEGEYGLVDGVRAVCRRCEHDVESFGTHDASRRRCLALMREECPRREQNFYADAADIE